MHTVFHCSWSPALQIRTVLLSIQALLSSPNPDDPLDNGTYLGAKEPYNSKENSCEAVACACACMTHSCFCAAAAEAWTTDEAGALAKAKEWTALYAMPATSTPSEEAAAAGGTD